MLPTSPGLSAALVSNLRDTAAFPEEEKEEERQGYLAHLKKKRQGKHNTHLSLPIPPDLLFPKPPVEKDDESEVILEQISSSEENC